MQNDLFFKPVSGKELPRFAGMPTFMRLPHVDINSDRIDEEDLGIIGVALPVA